MTEREEKPSEEALQPTRTQEHESPSHSSQVNMSQEGTERDPLLHPGEQAQPDIAHRRDVEDIENILHRIDSPEQQPLACSSPDDVLLSSTGLDLYPMSDDEYQPALDDPNVVQGIGNPMESQEQQLLSFSASEILQPMQPQSCSSPNDMLQSPSKIDPFHLHNIENQAEIIDPVVAQGIESILPPVPPLSCSSPDDMLQSATGLDPVPLSSEENQSATADPNIEEGISVDDQALETMVGDVSLEKLRSTDFPQLSISEISPLLKQPVVERMPLTGMQIQSGSSQATAQGFERILNEPPIVLKKIPVPTYPSATGTEIRQPGEKSFSNPQVQQNLIPTTEQADQPALDDALQAVKLTEEYSAEPEMETKKPGTALLFLPTGKRRREFDNPPPSSTKRKRTKSAPTLTLDPERSSEWARSVSPDMLVEKGAESPMDAESQGEEAE